MTRLNWSALAGASLSALVFTIACPATVSAQGFGSSGGGGHKSLFGGHGSSGGGGHKSLLSGHGSSGGGLTMPTLFSGHGSSGGGGHKSLLSGHGSSGGGGLAMPTLFSGHGSSGGGGHKSLFSGHGSSGGGGLAMPTLFSGHGSSGGGGHKSLLSGHGSSGGGGLKTPTLFSGRGSSGGGGHKSLSIGHGSSGGGGHKSLFSGHGSSGGSGGGSFGLTYNGDSTSTGTLLAQNSTISSIATAAAPTAAVAYLNVTVPAEAKVYLQDQLMTVNGTLRQFVSPALATGVQHVYTVRVEMDRNGQTVTKTTQAVVAAGQNVAVAFDMSDANPAATSVASR